MRIHNIFKHPTCPLLCCALACVVVEVDKRNLLKTLLIRQKSHHKSTQMFTSAPQRNCSSQSQKDFRCLICKTLSVSYSDISWVEFTRPKS